MSLDELHHLSQPVVNPGRFLYLIWDNDTIMYIGQTITLTKRMQQHLTYHSNYNRITIIPCSDDSITSIEHALIYKFQPKWNISGRKRLLKQLT